MYHINPRNFSRGEFCLHDNVAQIGQELIRISLIAFAACDSVSTFALTIRVTTRSIHRSSNITVAPTTTIGIAG